MGPNVHAQRVANNVRAEMARAKCPQTFLAEQLGLTQQALSRRISGHTVFRIDELQRIAEILNIPITRLVEEPQ